MAEGSMYVLLTDDTVVVDCSSLASSLGPRTHEKMGNKMIKTSSNEHKQESKTEPWIILTYTISTAKCLTNGF